MMNETAPLDACSDCKKPKDICVCDRLPTLKTKLRVVILQHPQEDDVELGTAILVARSLPNAVIEVGLSWPSLKHAVRDESAHPKRWGVIFPRKDAVVATQELGAELDGIIVLDGTWSQGKTLWWRNAWLLKLQAVAIAPKEPSIYGRIRREPRREFVSTLEATAEALTALGEDAETGAALKRAMRTMIQRARDRSSKSPR